MKNAKIILIVFIAIIIIIGIYFGIKLLFHNDNSKIQKGYKIYGSDICSRVTNNKEKKLLYEDSEHPIFGGCAITAWECAICGKTGESSTTVTPKLCSECADITNRCSTCGKLLSSE